MNDSTLLLVAAGLHSINLKTGEGWDYKAVTGAKDFWGMIFGNILGVATGVFTGYAPIFTQPNVIHSLISNIILEEDNIYMADKNRLVSLDYNGNIQWCYVFDEKVGQSNILVKDDVIYMVNTGYGIKGNRKILYGAPFIAAFNKITGEKLFFTRVETEQNPISDFCWKDDAIILLFTNKIEHYNLEEGAIQYRHINIEDVVNFVSRDYYVRIENKYVPLVSLDSQKVYAFGRDKIVEFSESLNFIGTMDFEKIYTCYLKTDNSYFLLKGDGTIVIDKNRREIGYLNITSKASLFGDKFYEVSENTFIEVGY